MLCDILILEVKQATESQNKPKTSPQRAIKSHRETKTSQTERKTDRSFNHPMYVMHIGSYPIFISELIDLVNAGSIAGIHRSNRLSISSGIRIE